MNTVELTPLGKSYWDKSGAYQSDFDRLTKELMPASGAGETLNAELIRACNRLFYEYCNNGNCNALEKEFGYESDRCWTCGGSGHYGDDEEDECDECCGSGEVEEEVETDAYVDSYFRKFLDLIKEFVPDAADDVQNVEDIIMEDLYSSKNQFSEHRMRAYSNMVDYVVYYVLNNEDKELPANYEKF